jgi:nitroimidazol reductase NimA-like FMN-containing flavoprotein (pyridoxamine 5'-phosphate oxidase superfamily)
MAAQDLSGGKGRSLRQDPTMIEELTAGEIDAFLGEEVVGRVGCHVDGLTYVVPVYFAYDGSAVHVLTIEGQKVEMMRASPDVCFEVDRYEPGTGSWRSVIAFGRYEELDEAGSERARALLRERLAPAGRRRPPPEPGGPRAVAFVIRIERATGRAVRR